MDSTLGEDQVIIEVLKQLVEPLAQSLPNTEVLVHDLSLLPNSIVAIHGDVTGREPGDPATDLLLEQAARQKFETRVGYYSRLPDGRRTKGTTIAITNGSGKAIAALCTNTDVGWWDELSTIISAMTEPAEPAEPAVEAFVHDVDELTDLLLRRAIEGQQVPVELMRKEHKVQVVRQVRAGGMFLLRDAAETVAAALEVSRFTIYNYINEIEEEDRILEELDQK